MQLRDIDPRERGRVAELGPADVLDALGGVRSGRIFDLDAGRFPGMPQWDGHPTFVLTTYRSPHGTAVQHDVPLLESRNSDGFGFVSELMITGMHIGTHIDALCHVTHGADGWCGGFTPAEHLGDFGAQRSDAATIPPIIVRCTLLDAAGHLGVEHLDAGQGLDADDLRRIEEAQESPIHPHGAVVVRTGLMSTWPDRARFDAASGAGPDLEASRWLHTERDVVLVGSDTPTFEQIPTTSEENPHPVHDYLLRQHGIHILENLWLEELARERVYSFTLICLSLKISGATGSMVRPVALA